MFWVLFKRDVIFFWQIWYLHFLEKKTQNSGKSGLGAGEDIAFGCHFNLRQIFYFLSENTHFCCFEILFEVSHRFEQATRAGQLQLER